MRKFPMAGLPHIPSELEIRDSLDQFLTGEHLEFKELKKR